MEFDIYRMKTPYEEGLSLEDYRRMTVGEKLVLMERMHAYARKLHDEQFLRQNPHLYPVDASANWMRISGITAVLPPAEFAFHTADEPVFVSVGESNR